MKRTIIQYLLVGIVCCLSSCYDDDSTLGSNYVSDIEIAGLADQSVVSYSQNFLNVQPTVTTDYPEDQLEYAWYIYADNTPEQENGFRKDRIATTKDLNYEVNLPSGLYHLVFEVTSLTNDFSKTATMNLSVSTAFSKGFYILKETADGNTDIDLWNEGILSEDILAKKLGAPMNGAPRNLSLVYTGEFINPELNRTARGNLVHIFTEENEYKGFESESLTEVFNNETLFYAGNMDNEEPYIIFRAPNHTVYFSNTGIRTAATVFSGTNYNSGRLGFPADEHGASKFIIPVSYGQEMVYWSNSEHALRNVNFNFQPSSLVTSADGSTYPDDLECISAGANITGDVYSPTVVAYFLCEQPSTGDRYLLLLDGGFTFTGVQIKQIIKLDPSLHIARDKIVAINRRTATYIYSISEDNKLYAYSWVSNDEREFPLPGIPAGEDITYLTNQYFYLSEVYGYDTSFNFDDLIVGTQTGNTYKLYFYSASKDMNGGRPIADPSRVITGTGQVKAVRFLVSMSVRGSDHYSDPIYPLTD